MTPNGRPRSGAVRLVGLLLAALLGAIAAMPASAGPGEALDAVIEQRRTSEVTFGHDVVDLQDALAEYALAILDKAELGGAADKVKNALFAGKEFIEASVEHGLSGAELNRFVTKTILDNLSDSEIVRLRQTFNISEKTAEAIQEHGVGLVEGGAEAAGTAAEGAYGEALQSGLIAVIDTLCAKCAIARKTALLAYDAARLSEAWIMDATTRMQFEAWKAWSGDDTLFMSTAGFTPTFIAARRALEAIHEGQGRTDAATAEEVMAFIRNRFESWKRMEDTQRHEAELLEEMKDLYLGLSDVERLAFGYGTEEGRAEAFANTALATYRDLMALKGDRVYPPGGREEFLRDVIRLARIRAPEGENAYHGWLLDTMRNYGWAINVPRDRKAAITQRLSERLPLMSLVKLNALFDLLNVPEKADLYHCVCYSNRGAGYSLVYDPEGGLPCKAIGTYGERREGFTSSSEVWKACLAATQVGGQNFDDYLAERILQWQHIN